MKNGRLNT